MQPMVRLLRAPAHPDVAVAAKAPAEEDPPQEGAPEPQQPDRGGQRVAGLAEPAEPSREAVPEGAEGQEHERAGHRVLPLPSSGPDGPCSAPVTRRKMSSSVAVEASSGTRARISARLP